MKHEAFVDPDPPEICALSTASAGPKGEDFDPLKFFTGRTRSTGVFENRGGDPTQPVSTETRGRVVNGELHMEQHLCIGNTPRQRRFWRLRKIDAQHYEARANDIVGVARGKVYRNRFSWSFTLATKPGHPLFNVRMTQHMYLQPDGTMINRTRLSKLGFFVAGVTEQFRRQ